MALDSWCKTDGAVYEAEVTETYVSVKVELPFPLHIGEIKKQDLIRTMHNAMELALAPLWLGYYDGN